MRADHAPQAELADRIARLTPRDGFHPTAIPQLYLIRISTPQPCSPALYEPRLGIIAQGSKLVMLAGETYRCDPLHCLVVSMTLPVIGQVIEATPEKPYLSLRLDIDLDELSALVLDAEPPPAHSIDRGLYVARANAPMLDAALRLMRLLDTPRDLRVLAPAALREIFYRVLIGDLGHRLRDLATAGSRSNRIARAVARLREGYQQPLSIDELAELAAHEHVLAAPPVQGGDVDVAAAVPEATAPARSAAADADGGPGSQYRRAPRRLRKPVAVQPRIQTPVRRAAAFGDRAGQGRAPGLSRRHARAPKGMRITVQGNALASGFRIFRLQAFLKSDGFTPASRRNVRAK